MSAAYAPVAAPPRPPLREGGEERRLPVRRALEAAAVQVFPGGKKGGWRKPCSTTQPHRLHFHLLQIQLLLALGALVMMLALNQLPL